ncbi:MAG: cytochrome b [Alphaproteobacteria bacterium]|nr:cytochrome b [Alphaproteobacteria bacterium]
MTSEPGASGPYSKTARRFHWWTFALIVIQAPVGIAMVWRGKSLDIWDAATNTLYDTHKLIGFTALLLIVARLIYRLVHGRPADKPTLEPWQRRVSHVVHWAIYALLLTVALLGWFGVQLFPALTIFGLFDLPAIVSPDQAAADRVLELHRTMAFLLLLLIGLHVAAALFHYLIRKDGVLHRMWVSAPKRTP